MRKKLVKPLLFCTGLLALYALTGFYLLPYLLKTKLPDLITQQTKTPTTLSQVTFNPFTLALTLNGFELQDKQKQPFVKFDGLGLDINALDSIKTLTLVIEQLRLDKLQTRVAAFKDGQFNFSDLFPPGNDQEPEPDQAIFPVLFRQIQLNEGAVTWDDQRLSQPETAVVAPINVTLNDLSLRQDTATKLNLSMAVQAGGKIDWQMALSPNDKLYSGTIQIKGIKAERLWALVLQDRVNFKIPQGETDLSFNYQWTTPATGDAQLILSDGLFASRNLQFTALDNAKPLITVPDLTVRGIVFDLLKQSVTLAAVEANAVNLSVAANAAGELNVQALFAPKPSATVAPPTPPVPPKAAALVKPWLITIANVAIHKLQADYSDAGVTAPLTAKWAGLDVDLANYQLRYAESLQMQMQEGKLSLQDFNLNGIRLAKDGTPLQVKWDAFQADLANVQLDSGGQALQINADNGNARLQKFTVQEAGAAPALISLPEVALSGAKLDLAKQQLDIGKLQASGASLRAWLDKAGQLNYAALMAEKTAAAKVSIPEPVKPPPATPPFAVSLAELDVQNFQFDFQDKSRKKPLDVQLSAINLKAQRLSNQKGNKSPFTLRTKIKSGGTLDVKGQVLLEPFAAELQTTLNNVKLAPFQSYLNEALRVDIIDGAFNTTAKITLNKADAKADLGLRAKGSANIKQLVMRDQILNKDLIKWQAVKFEGIDFDLATLKLNVGHILLQEPYARVTIKEDRTLNFAELIVKQPAAIKTKQTVKPRPVATKKPLTPEYKIEAVTIDGGSSDFSDFSLILPFVVQLNDLNGAIKRISSTQKQLTNFSLAGKVFDLSPMSMDGQFLPDLSTLDIGMHFKGMPLPFISPYMVEFAGYKIEKGKMSLDLLYKVTDRKLTAENNMVLDQLTLGEKVENPKASSLPLNLAISLLKDANGKIVINMPITGSLDDPQFSVTSLVFDAFVNMLTKVISSPFKMLGSLVADDADLSQISFKEGSAELSDANLTKLQELAKGLAQKTALSVDIKGSAYTKQDWPAMQEDALLDQLKAIKSTQLKASGKNQLAEHVQLSEGDYQSLLADLFINKFPHLAKRSLLGTPELIGSDKDFATIAKQQLAAIIPPDKLKLSALAATRARNIAQALIQKGGISHERIFILDVNVQPESSQAELASELSLKAQ